MDYNKHNQLTSWEKSINDQIEKNTFEYDNEGNIVEIFREVAGQNKKELIREFKYDIINNMVEYKDLKNDIHVGYEYDANTLRKSKFTIDKNSNAVDDKITYYYKGIECINESQVSKNTKKEVFSSYLFLAGKRMGRFIHGGEYTSDSYYNCSLKDNIGFFNKVGVLTKQYDYASYGKVKKATKASNTATDSNYYLKEKRFDIKKNTYMYSGYSFDVESGFYYLKARFYSPNLMSFISRDTYDLPNRYAYCDGNPIVNFDPNGHESWDAYAGSMILSFAIGATVGGIAGALTGGVGMPIALGVLVDTISGALSAPAGVYTANAIDNKDTSTDTLISSSVVGGIAGAFFGALFRGVAHKLGWTYGRGITDKKIQLWKWRDVESHIDDIIVPYEDHVAFINPNGNGYIFNETLLDSIANFQARHGARVTVISSNPFIPRQQVVDALEARGITDINLFAHSDANVQGNWLRSNFVTARERSRTSVIFTYMCNDLNENIDNDGFRCALVCSLKSSSLTSSDGLTSNYDDSIYDGSIYDDSVMNKSAVLPHNDGSIAGASNASRYTNYNKVKFPDNESYNQFR